MPLLGDAAMLLSFDITPEGYAEHDHWHTHEHLPERLSIPGFLRGTRWTATQGQPRYLVLYEVEGLQTLTSEAYLRRLNNPTPWTQRMMPLYRGMTRGLCSVLGSFGPGQGGHASLLRLRSSDGPRTALVEWLLGTVLPEVPGTVGLGSAHLLQGAQVAAMTTEQRIRGADAAVDLAVIVTGHDPAALTGFYEAKFGDGQLLKFGVTNAQHATYGVAYSLAAAEIAA
jgi:hypothetical protein